MQPAAPLTNPVELIRFLEMLHKPPSVDIEKGILKAKPRLFLNTATGEISWLQSEQDREVCNVTQFDIVLRSVAGKIKGVSLQSLPNNESKETLKRLIPQVKQALSERITLFDQRHNRWFSCYFWKGAHAQVIALHHVLNLEIEALSTKVAQVPLAFIPPPPPAGKGLKKTGAKQQQLAAEAAGDAMPASQPTAAEVPAPPAQRARAKSDAPQPALTLAAINATKLKPIPKNPKL